MFAGLWPNEFFVEVAQFVESNSTVRINADSGQVGKFPLKTANFHEAGPGSFTFVLGLLAADFFN